MPKFEHQWMFSPCPECPPPSHPVNLTSSGGKYRIGAGHSSCHATPPMRSRVCSSPPSDCSAPGQPLSPGSPSSCVLHPRCGSLRWRRGGLSSRQSRRRERKKDLLARPQRTEGEQLIPIQPGSFAPYHIVRARGREQRPRGPGRPLGRHFVSDGRRPVVGEGPSTIYYPFRSPIRC